MEFLTPGNVVYIDYSYLCSFFLAKFLCFLPELLFLVVPGKQACLDLGLVAGFRLSTEEGWFCHDI
jgi:hypothetical protein